MCEPAKTLILKADHEEQQKGSKESYEKSTLEKDKDNHFGLNLNSLHSNDK